MAYSSYQAALDAQRRAFEALKRQYPGKNIGGRQFYNVPYSARQAFNKKWNAIVQQAEHNRGKANPNPSSRYAKMTAAEQRAVDNRKDAAAAKAYANPSFADPAPPPAQANPVADVTATYESKIKELQDLIAQQTADFQSQQQQMMDGLAAQQESYNTLTQQTANAQRAYTPAPEETATETKTAGSSSNTRRLARGGLSSLAIIEGLGTNANPLSGLQLA